VIGPGICRSLLAGDSALGRPAEVLSRLQAGSYKKSNAKPFSPPGYFVPVAAPLFFATQASYSARGMNFSEAELMQ
jgi:hypothetical protein